MKIGYARVSTTGQSLDNQIKALTAFGCEKIYQEKKTGASRKERVELEQALDYAREGDIFVTTKLDRLARSVLDLTQIVEQLNKKSVGFIVIDQQIDTTTPTGKLLFHVISAIGEFERDLINERMSEGRKEAKAKGVKFGAKPKVTGERLEELKRDFKNPDMSKSDIAEKYSISRSSVYRLVNDKK